MTYRIRLFLCSIGFVLAFCVNAAAQIAPGSVSSAPWPVYVHDTETLEEDNIIVSAIGGIGFLPDDTTSNSIYSELDLGISSRFLIAFAMSAAKDEASGWNFDDTVLHAKYKLLDGEKVDFAIAGSLERLPFMKETGHSAYDGQVIAIAQKSIGSYGIYGQIGYSSRNQVFEGFGAKYDFSGKAIVTGNFSYRHQGDFFEGLLPEQISGVKAIMYTTVYASVGSRVGLTAAFGRTLLPINEGVPATLFCTFGFGVRLR